MVDKNTNLDTAEDEGSEGFLFGSSSRSETVPEKEAIDKGFVVIKGDPALEEQFTEKENIPDPEEVKKETIPDYVKPKFSIFKEKITPSRLSVSAGPLGMETSPVNELNNLSFDEQVEILEQREKAKVQSDILKQKERIFQENVLKRPFRDENNPIFSTLVPIGDEYDPDSGIPADYHYFPRGKEHPYTIIAKTPKDAFNAAMSIHDELKKSGAKFYTGAYKNLESLSKELLAARGDLYAVTQAVRKESSKDYTRNLNWLNDRKQLENMPNDTKDMVASFMTLAENGAMAIPNYFYSLSPDVASGLDQILGIIPPLDGALLDVVAASSNYLEKVEDKGGVWTDIMSKLHVPYMGIISTTQKNLGDKPNSTFFIDSNVSYNDNKIAKVISADWPKQEIRGEDLLSQMEGSENPNLLVGAVRIFARDFSFALGVLSPLAKTAVNYSTRLAKEAEQNLLRKKIPVSQATVYNEMESLIETQWKKSKDKNDNRIIRYIQVESRLGAAEFGYVPYTFFKKFAGTESMIGVATEAVDRWIYPSALEQLKMVKEDDPLGALNFGLTFTSSIAGIIGGKVTAAGLDYGVSKVLPVVETLNNSLKTILPQNKADAQGLRKMINIMSKPTDAIDALLKKASPIFSKDIDPGQRKILRNVLQTFYKLNKSDEKEADKIRKSLLYVEELFNEADEVGLGDVVNKTQITLGSATGIASLRQAEMQMLELVAGKDLKIDQKFKFIKKAMELGNLREKQEMELGKVLTNLSEEIKDKNLPTLNAFKDLAAKTLRETTEKNAEIAYLTERAVQLQVSEILMGTKFDTDTGRELMEILQNNPSLRLSNETIAQTKKTFDLHGLLKLDSLFNSRAAEQMDDELIKLNPVFTDANIQNYGEGNGFKVKRQNIGAAADIQNYASTVSLVNIARAEDFHEVWGSAQYQKAFDLIGSTLQKGDDDIDVTEFLIGINKKARSGGLLEADDTFIKAINPFLEKIQKKQVTDAIEKITARIMKDKPDWDVKKTKTMINKGMAADENMIKRKGKFNTLDQIEYLQDKYNFNFTMSFEEVYNMRKFSAAVRRDVAKTDSTKARMMETVTNDVDNLINSKITVFRGRAEDVSFDLELRKNYAKAARQFAFAKENYSIVKARQRQSLILRDVTKFTQRLDRRGKTKKDAESLIEFKDEKTGLPSNKKMYSGNNASGRMFSKDQNKFLDEMFSGKYSGKQIYEELKVIYGEVIDVQDNVYVFRLPQEGDSLFHSYQNFLKSANVYITARHKKALNELEASGKWNWNKISKDVKGLKQFEQNLKFGQTPAYLTSTGEGSHLEFGKVIEELDKKIRGDSNNKHVNLMGTDIHKEIFTRMNIENQAGPIVAQTMTQLANAVEKAAPEAKKYSNAVKSMVMDLNSKGSKTDRITNAESFVDIMMGDMHFVDSPVEGVQKTLRGEATEETSPLLDSVIKSSIDNGMSEEEAKDAVSKLIAVGITQKATKTTDSYKWQTTDRYKNLRSAGADLENYPDGTTQKQVDNQLKEFDKLSPTDKEGPRELAGIGDNSMKKEAEIYVDGRALYEIFDNNEAFLRKYLTKDKYDKIKVIMKLSTISSDAAQLSLKDPTHGLPKMQFNTVMSRAAAVYSQRASIRYPLMEMTFSLAKQKEAEAVAALLSADGEFIDLVTDIMLTGNFEARMNDPRTYKMFEAFFADAVGMSGNMIEALTDVQQTLSDDDKFLVAMYSLYPEISPEELFPFSSKTADKYQSLNNFTQGKRSENASNFSRREAYHKYIGRMFNEQKQGTTDLQIINKIKSDLETIPLDILLGTKKKAYITLGE